MTDCVYFLLYLALGKLSLMLLINYYIIEVKSGAFIRHNNNVEALLI